MRGSLPRHSTTPARETLRTSTTEPRNHQGDGFSWSGSFEQAPAGERFPEQDSQGKHVRAAIELFGHERGAFTGAVAARAGAFDQAHGGTLFLDEVGELSPNAQPKLLRALENRAFRRVGGTKQIDVDVRVVAATNRGLAEAVRLGTFRQDLYYRLSVVKLNVPPLSERAADIPLLAELFFRRARPGDGGSLPPELLQLLSAYSWPGNARELRNVIDRFATFNRADPTLLFDAPVAGSSPRNAASPQRASGAPSVSRSETRAPR